MRLVPYILLIQLRALSSLEEVQFVVNCQFYGVEKIKLISLQSKIFVHTQKSCSHLWDSCLLTNLRYLTKDFFCFFEQL